jgi:hypothetical protein
MMQQRCNGRAATLLRALLVKLVDDREDREQLLAQVEAGEHEAVLEKLERLALELARRERRA